MGKIDGELKDACLEQRSSDPSTSTQGRIWENTTEGKVKSDNGTSKRAFIKTDDKAIFGNSGTATDNTRIHRGGAGLIQTVKSDDVTAEGSPSNSLNQLSTRDENQTAGGLPAAGNTGRNIFVTDQVVTAVDDGITFRRITPSFSANDATSGTTITLATVTSSLVRLTGSFATIEMIPAGFSGQRFCLINRTGSDVAIADNSGATAANRILTGTGANATLKADASIFLEYDSTTQRWQMVGATTLAAGTPNSNIRSVSSNDTVLITDDIILVDTSSSAVSLTLPSAAGNSGKRFLFEKTSASNFMTLTGTVDGVTNPTYSANRTPTEIVSNGTIWTNIGPQALNTSLSTGGTFTVPPNVRLIQILAIGQGGGGAGGAGGGVGSSATEGGGGGGGGAAEPLMVNYQSTPGETLTITVESLSNAGGGGSGLNAGGNGTAGGKTIVRNSSGTIITAIGGRGGTTGVPGNNNTTGGGGGGAGGVSTLYGSISDFSTSGGAGAVFNSSPGQNGGSWLGTTTSQGGTIGGGGGGGGGTGSYSVGNRPSGTGGSTDGASGGASSSTNGGGGGGAGGRSVFGAGGTGGNSVSSGVGGAGSAPGASSYGAGGGGGAGGGSNPSAGGAGAAGKSGAALFTWWAS